VQQAVEDSADEVRRLMVQLGEQSEIILELRTELRDAIARADAAEGKLEHVRPYADRVSAETRRVALELQAAQTLTSSMTAALEDVQFKATEMQNAGTELAHSEAEAQREAREAVLANSALRTELGKVRQQLSDAQSDLVMADLAVSQSEDAIAELQAEAEHKVRRSGSSAAQFSSGQDELARMREELRQSREVTKQAETSNARMQDELVCAKRDVELARREAVAARQAAEQAEASAFEEKARANRAARELQTEMVRRNAAIEESLEAERLKLRSVVEDAAPAVDELLSAIVSARGIYCSVLAALDEAAKVAAHAANNFQQECLDAPGQEKTSAATAITPSLGFFAVGSRVIEEGGETCSSAPLEVEHIVQGLGGTEPSPHRISVGAAARDSNLSTPPPTCLQPSLVIDNHEGDWSGPQHQESPEPAIANSLTGGVAAVLNEQHAVKPLEAHRSGSKGGASDKRTVTAEVACEESSPAHDVDVSRGFGGDVVSEAGWLTSCGKRSLSSAHSSAPASSAPAVVSRDAHCCSIGQSPSASSSIEVGGNITLKALKPAFLKFDEPSAVLGALITNAPVASSELPHPSSAAPQQATHEPESTLGRALSTGSTTPSTATSSSALFPPGRCDAPHAVHSMPQLHVDIVRMTTSLPKPAKAPSLVQEDWTQRVFTEAFGVLSPGGEDFGAEAFGAGDFGPADNATCQIGTPNGSFGQNYVPEVDEMDAMLRISEENEPDESDHIGRQVDSVKPQARVVEAVLPAALGPEELAAHDSTAPESLAESPSAIARRNVGSRNTSPIHAAAVRSPSVKVNSVDRERCTKTNTLKAICLCDTCRAPSSADLRLAQDEEWAVQRQREMVAELDALKSKARQRSVADEIAALDKNDTMASPPMTLTPTKVHQPSNSWRAVTETDGGKTYYYNVESHETAWELPEGACLID